MSKKDEPEWKKARRRKQAGIENSNFSIAGDNKNLLLQKQKARELRNSAWWKKKISDGKCYYCGKEFNPTDLTMDHKIPLSRGGKSEKINLVPACKECNNKKKYLLPTEWDEYLEDIKNRKEF